MSLLETRRLAKSFKAFEAVKGVSLDVRPGEIVGLLGANGAGKTTFMRCALGILAPTAGEALLFGEAPSRQARRRLGYVPQGRGLYGDLTSSENADFVAQAYGSPPATTGRDRRVVGALPLGDQRRLAFDLALSHDPELLVLDEPTSGVGPTESARLWDIIGERAAAGVGVLVTTHNMGEAQQCDRLALMVDGRVVAEGSEADVIGGATVVDVEVDDWRTAFETLRAAGMLVSLSGRNVRVMGATLHAVQAALGSPARLTVEPATLEERMALANS